MGGWEIKMSEDRQVFDNNEPSHSPSGVDLTLIRWMLTLTPRERLQVLQDHVDSIYAIRAANSQR